MDLDLINTLFLELSQVATATTSRERALQNGISQAREDALKLCWQIEESGASPALTKCSEMALALHTMLNELLP